MTALEEILVWSASASSWMRDALRRILVHAEVSDADLGALVELCKSPHGLSPDAPKAEYLTRDHIPAEQAGGAVALTSITHVADVNALAPNETLSLAPTGLTVIYGDNGAGKSGFTRILRRACRARGGNDPVLANALSDKPAGAPTAKIAFTVGGVPREDTWKDGAAAASELSAVSVFDSTSAQVYVEEKTEVRFRPLGLDVTDRLAVLCVRVKKALEDEKDQLRARTIVLPALAPTTEAGRLLAGLSALTSHAEVDRLGKLTDEEAKELETLEHVLATARAEDPRKKAADLRLKAGRLRRLLEEVRAVATMLAEERLRDLATLAAEAGTAAAEAQRAADAFAKEAELAGLGSAEWKALWNDARAYSEEHAYPDHEFPHTAADALCVLCQQKLQPVAQARLKRFEAFVVGATQEAARIKKGAVDKARSAVADLRPGDRSQETLADLAGLDGDVAAAVEAFFGAARACRDDIVAAVPTPRVLDVQAPTARLDTLARDLEARAEALSRAGDPEARARSEKRAAELAARKTLAASLPQIHQEIDRRAKLNAYDQCIKDTDTRSLTKVSVELTKKHVTDALTHAFADELTKLGFTTLELELKPASAQRGMLFHKVQLKHATRAELPKVVSEGESRCIALAAFMAELSGADRSSSIVFDDPVSSLDHRWRTNVARRLVAAARTRQVIVFTHELVFLATLLQEAEKEGVAAETHTLARDHAYAGHVTAGLPWHGLSTKKRIGMLRQRWVEAEKTYRTAGQNAYDPIATGVYADLRRTWERAIEEVLLNQVILRFRAGVETNRLKKLGDITQADLDAVDNGMTKSSKWEGGHDQAQAVNEPLPPPAELKQDIDALETWVNAVEKRRKP